VYLVASLQHNQQVNQLTSRQEGQLDNLHTNLVIKPQCNPLHNLPVSPLTSQQDSRQCNPSHIHPLNQLISQRNNHLHNLVTSPIHSLRRNPLISLQVNHPHIHLIGLRTGQRRSQAHNLVASLLRIHLDNLRHTQLVNQLINHMLPLH
jgi:hypothetical protein